MNYQNDLPNHQNEESTSIPRSPSICDLTSLAHNIPRTRHKSKYRRSVSFASADQSGCYGSENSQVLYVASPPKRSRKLRSSLSSIGNRSTRIMDGSLDTKADAEGYSLSDGLTWNMIDREIFEWQYVCRTGRPYWWSPQSKCSPLKRLPARLSNEAPLRLGMREIAGCLTNEYSNKRRTVSDSYLAGQDCAEDLAHLAAIQLLGSCFTIPPDHNGLPAPDYTSYNLNGPPNSPDPRLISSLRMHTHFRYSPCFGHQARNTSPVRLWSGSNDGPSPGSSPLFAATGFQTPVIGTSGSLPRRRRAHRASNFTEGSASSCYSDNQPEEYLKFASKCNLDPTAVATARYRRQGIDDDNARPTTYLYLPSQSRRRPPRPTPVRTDGDIDMPDGYRGVQLSSRSPATNYRLQPVIRSEPHHVFVQPVKELVVKRWRTFRRRFGGSLNGPLPTDSEEFMSEGSTCARSGISSPAMSSDGRTRRRRAQERGDIDGSVDSTPHYNSPVTGYQTPNGSGFPNPFWVDSTNASPSFELADPLTAAAALALAETQAWCSNSASANPLIPADSVAAGDNPTAEGRTQSKLAPNPSTPSYTKRIRKRQHRKSMLSEMHIPEDFGENVAGGENDKEAVDRSVLSAAGNALSSPKEELESDIDHVIQTKARESIGNLGPLRAFSMRRMTVSSDSRPSLRLSRTSTTGTQVFTPSDEGVEIDGLPVGPSKELWHTCCDGRDKRRERTYL